MSSIDHAHAAHNGAIVSIAHALSDCDIASIPIRPDGTKAPAVESWRYYQRKAPTHRQIDAMFKPGHGIAVIGGNGLEVLDFDEPALIDPWQQRVEAQAPGLVDRLPSAETPSGGRHFYYKHAGVELGSQKLARALRNGTPETLIETKAKGGYAITPPSPAQCHPDGKPYTMLQGSLLELPTLTANEREVLLSTARQFNEIRVEHAEAQPRGRPSAAREDLPGSHFNHRASWSDVLQPHGWRIEGSDGRTVYWTGPGKQRGISASTNFGGSDLLYVFSTNADPFDHERSYSKFAAYTVLECGGDFRLAYRRLALQGFGVLSLLQMVRLLTLLTKHKGYWRGTCPACGAAEALGVFPPYDIFRCERCHVQGGSTPLRALLRARRGGI